MAWSLKSLPAHLLSKITSTFSIFFLKWRSWKLCATQDVVWNQHRIWDSISDSTSVGYACADPQCFKASLPPYTECTRVYDCVCIRTQTHGLFPYNHHGFLLFTLGLSLGVLFYLRRRPLRQWFLLTTWLCGPSGSTEGGKGSEAVEWKLTHTFFAGSVPGYHRTVWDDNIFPE